MESNTTSPRISAVIVTYQSDLNALKRAVDSLRSCTLPIEILLVDNNSGADYRGDLGRAFSDIRIIDSGLNKGFGAGHNLGFALREQPSDYHLVVNPDVIIPLGAIEEMVQFMGTRHKVGLATPKIVNEQGEMQYLCKRKPSIAALFGRRFLPAKLADMLLKGVMDHYIMRDKNYEKIIEPDFLSGCFMVFRSDIFQALEGFDERFFLYFEDADITMRAKAISQAVYFPGVTITHAWQGGARNSRALTKIMLISAYQFFRKWGIKWW